MKSILVTGASSGIGRHAALTLASKGFRVFAGVRREDAAMALDADFAKTEAVRGGSITPVILDVTRPDQIRKCFEVVAGTVGEEGLDGLVNNAGIVIAGPLELLPLESLREQFEVNVLAPVAMVQAFLPLLRKAKGRIVNVGSLSGWVATPFVGPYSASKFALRALTDALRVELRPWHIGISLIEPGPVETPIWERSTNRAQNMRAQLSIEARRLYHEAMESALKSVEVASRRAVPVQKTTDAIVHALTARRPKIRYPVGALAKAEMALATVLPDKWRDEIIARGMRLTK